jgi:hypothetical protein
MADTITPSKHQSLNEVRQWDIDFSADLETGVTVVSATATHIPPSGAASTPSIGSIAHNIVPVRLGPLSVAGIHALNVLATYSDSEKGEAHLLITVDDFTNKDVETIQGIDYSNADGTSLKWTNEGGTWPDLTDAEISVHIEGGLEFDGSVITPTGAGQTVRCELSAAQTASIPVCSVPFQVIATLKTSLHQVVLVQANWISKAKD